MSPKLLLTNKCNRACEFCFQTSMAIRDAEISIPDFNSLLLWLKFQNINTLTLLGGEPTIHRNFSHLLKLANDMNFHINMLSNLLFKKDIFSFFKNIQNICANITLFDTYTITEQNRILENLATLENLKIDVLLSCTIYKTDQSIEHILGIAKKYSNIREIRLDLARPSIDKKNKYISIKKIESHKTQLLSYIREVESIGLNVLFDCPFPKCFFTSEEINSYDLPSKGLSHNECGNLLINPDLSIASCPFYNLTEKKITDFSSFSEAKEFIVDNKEIERLKYSVCSLPLCKTCQSRIDKSCTGYCIAEKAIYNQN
nr:radical SAM protein [Desulfosarcina ovata]